MQERIKTCFKVCLAQSGHGMRCIANWVYEYILMKIKSSFVSKMYREKILPSSSNVTLKILNYLMNFSLILFKCLKKKLNI